MSQVSYGTITITDTNDIERIYTVYAKSAKNTVVPTAAASDWKELISEAPGTGNYIWQRTVVEKSGTGDKTYSSPVCLTGEEAKDIIAIEVQYGISADWDTQPQSDSWSENTPSYDSSKPNYWTRTRLKYEGNTYSSWVVNKDYALTEAIYNSAVANSIAQQTIEDSQGAMSQANNGIKEIYRVWYRTNSGATLSKPSTHVTETRNDINNTWTKVKPIENSDYRYYFYCEETITNGGVSSWTNPVLDITTLSKYEVEALDSRTKTFFFPGDSSYPGAYVVGKNSDDGLRQDDISTYGFNTRVTTTGISIGYNEAKVLHLKTTPSPASLDFYKPPTISGNTVEEGELAASLSATGLILKKGGVKAGSPNQSGFIYLSTEPYGSYSVNGSSGISDWKEIIGTKFGVTSDGTLYADGANITNINANNISTNLLSAIQAKVSMLSAITANMGTLTAGTISYETTGNNNSFYLSANSSKTATIAGASRSSLRLTVGSGFGVDVNGKLYATGADITGAIKAQSLTIESNATISDTSGLIRNDAVEIGGRNLLKKSNEPRNNSDYAIGSWYFGEDPPKEGETVTVQIKGKLADAKTKWGVYNSGGSVSVFFIYPSAYDSTTGIYTYTGPWKITLGSTTASNDYMRIYAMESGQSGTSTIEWVKLERGNKPSDWTAAPEDTDAGGGGKNLLYNSGIGKVGGQSVKGWRASGGTVSHVDLSSSPVSGVTGAVRATRTESSTGNIGIAQDGFANSFIAGELYSQGAWIRGSSAFACYFQPIWNGSSNTTGNSNDFTITTDWKYYKVEGLKLLGSQQSTYSAGYFYARNVPTGGWVEVCGMKLERGATATDWTAAPEDMHVGGRNLLRNSADPSATFPNMCSIEVENGENYIKFNQTSQNWSNFNFRPRIPLGLVKDQTITVSFEARGYDLPSTPTASWLYVNPQTYETATDGNRIKYLNKSWDSSAFKANEWVKLSYTLPVNLNEWTTTSGKESTPQNYFTLCVYNYSGKRIDLRRFKVEYGNVATDWTPAPEDVASDIDDASKVANNYLKFEPNKGLMIADVSNGTSTIDNVTTGNVLIDDNSVDIRKGQKVLTTIYGDGLMVNDDTESPVASFLKSGATVGKAVDGQSRMVTSGTGMQFIRRNGTTDEVLAHIGYGEGQAESGTLIKPYYSMGLRKSGTTIGNYSMASGYHTTASGHCSHAEGDGTTASDTTSHAEGTSTISSDKAAHAEGHTTIASGSASHAEGFETKAIGDSAHAEGSNTEANAENSHAQNLGTVAQGFSQTVIGTYNQKQGSASNSRQMTDYAFIIGNGDKDTRRSNAFAVDWNGKVWHSGDGQHNIADYVKTSKGTFVSGYIVVYGKVAQLNFTFRNTSSIAGGNTLYEGTLSSNSGWLPKQAARGIGYLGPTPFIITIGAGGGIIIQNASQATVIIPSNKSAYCTVTYIMA